jgi:hypothetical protein
MKIENSSSEKTMTAIAHQMDLNKRVAAERVGRILGFSFGPFVLLVHYGESQTALMALYNAERKTPPVQSYLGYIPREIFQEVRGGRTQQPARCCTALMERRMHVVRSSFGSITTKAFQVKLQ